MAKLKLDTSKRELYYKYYGLLRRLVRHNMPLNEALNLEDVQALPDDVRMGLSHALGAFDMPEPYCVPAREWLGMHRYLRKHGHRGPYTPRYISFYNAASQRLPK